MMKSIESDIQRNIDVRKIKDIFSRDFKSTQVPKDQNFDINLPSNISSRDVITHYDSNIHDDIEPEFSGTVNISQINVPESSLTKETGRCYSTPFNMEVWSWR